jgi:hypothetical protein
MADTAPSHLEPHQRRGAARGRAELLRLEADGQCRRCEREERCLHFESVRFLLPVCKLFPSPFTSGYASSPVPGDVLLN